MRQVKYSYKKHDALTRHQQCIEWLHDMCVTCMGQATRAWGEEEKATLRRRERQVQEAEERADTLLQSAAAEVDRQSQALEEERHALQQQQLAFEQVALMLPTLPSPCSCHRQPCMWLRYCQHDLCWSERASDLVPFVDVCDHCITNTSAVCWGKHAHCG